jgi:hypothetical protein
VFGHKIQSVYYNYFLILEFPPPFFYGCFNLKPILFASNLFTSHNLGSISDPRFLCIVTTVPGAGFLMADSDQRRLSRNGVYWRRPGFCVPLLPILLTVPNYPTMGDQYFRFADHARLLGRIGVRHGLRVLLGARHR